MTPAGTDDIARRIETDDPMLNETFIATFLGWDGGGDPPPLFTSVEAVMGLLPKGNKFIVARRAMGVFAQLVPINLPRRALGSGSHEKNAARACLAALVRVKGRK